MNLNTTLIIPSVGGALNIRSITENPKGVIWIGTDGNGVFRMEGDSVKNYNTEDGLLSDFCNALVGDHEKYIWASHRGELSRIRISDGFVSNMKDELQLPPGRHTIRIDFMGINLENPGAITYSYMMEGLDDSWPLASRENHEIFSKIPDGKYTFKLRAFNSDGTFNEKPLKLQIHISVPMYKRWWVYVVLVIVLISGVRAIIKRREYNLMLEKERLEKIVMKRTHEVVEQKEEIEHQRDAIQSQNENIRLINKNINDSIIYASRIQKAVFPPVETLARMEERMDDWMDMNR